MEHSVNDIADFEAHIASFLTGRVEPDRSDLERYLRANPGMTVGDWKGLGPVVPPDAQRWEKPWKRLKPDEVKAEAVRHFARELPRNLRQAAAHHPGLIWNAVARKYRPRLASDPAADAYPASEVNALAPQGPAAVHRFSANPSFVHPFRS